jgi:phosphate transport system substrate-binding protein
VPYSIAYVGISYRAVIQTHKLGEAALENRAGKFVLSTAATVKTAADELSATTPKNESVSLIFAPGDDSYPIINYEYVIVDSRQPNAALAAGIKSFLSWAVLPTQGNAPHFLDQVSFMALPPAIARLSNTQIDTISAN